MKSYRAKAIFSGFLAIILFVVAVYFLQLYSRVDKILTSVANGPIVRQSVDFSKTNVYEIPLKHTCNPLYGTSCLILKTTPTPSEWKSQNDSYDAMKKMVATMSLKDTQGRMVREGELKWFYWYGFRSEDFYPRAQFFTEFPEGEYSLSIKVVSGVAALAGLQQELTIEYGVIHERSIRVFSKLALWLCVVFGAVLIGLSGRYFQKSRHS